MGEKEKVNVKELIGKLGDQVFAVKIADGLVKNRERETLKNLLVNNAEQIMEALSLAAEAEEKIALLEQELDDADKELDEKEAEIQSLKGGKKASGK